MKYSSKNPPLYCKFTQSQWAKEALKDSTPLGILWHDTSAGNPYIKRYAQPDDDATDKDYWYDLLGVNRYNNDWNNSNVSKGVNAFVGKLADDSIATVQVGEWTTNAWGCGSGDKGSCNGYIWDSKGRQKWVDKFWIQFEICDDDYKNGNSSKEYFDAVYTEACELTAYLCKLYNINPNGTVVFNGVTVPTILCHSDSHKLKLGSDHSDVLKWFKKYGKTMDDVRNDVTHILEQDREEEIAKEKAEEVIVETPKEDDGVYRVNKSLDDIPLFITGIDLAIEACDRLGEGYKVYSSSNEVVYFVPLQEHHNDNVVETHIYVETDEETDGKRSAWGTLISFLVRVLRNLAKDGK